ncbi:MAG: ferric reductase-like transmembrane domain-containing protein [Candidatus Marinimicrobia bacterium]|nr:ferric reductase-like transmembrane domain-containing protein [Candidatus Neomarinimicrobiota bacterium]
MSLSVSPLVFITGKNYLSPLRKLLGLYSALYATLHFSIFVGLDYFFDWELISDAIIEKPYVLAGFSAFLILSVMAITSTKGWKRRLKKKWKPLHRFVYLAGFLVVLHYVWLVKSDIREPLAYGFVIGLLLTLRIPRIRSLVSAWKEKRISQILEEKT